MALFPFDRLFAREWLPQIDRLELIGASIGAWRMAALAQSDALTALDRLQQVYVHEQNYPPRPSRAQVAATCRAVAHAVTDGASLTPRRRRLAIRDHRSVPRPLAEWKPQRVRACRHRQRDRAASPGRPYASSRVPRGRAIGTPRRRSVRLRSGRDGRCQPRGRAACVGFDTADLRARAQHQRRSTRRLLGWRPDRLPLALAVRADIRAGAVSALRALGNAGMARQIPALARAAAPA